jgi:hypothetical protein
MRRIMMSRKLCLLTLVFVLGLMAGPANAAEDVNDVNDVNDVGPLFLCWA